MRRVRPHPTSGQRVDILYLLVPLSVLVVLGLVAIFAWALFSDQFEDLAREGERILDDEQRQP